MFGKMGNMAELMKKAQQMQSKMKEAQDKLGDIDVEGSAGNGLVKVAMNGKGDVKSVKIDPSLAVADELDVLEDLVVAAINDGKAKAEAVAADEMAKVTGGLGLPGGMKLPF